MFNNKEKEARYDCWQGRVDSQRNNQEWRESTSKKLKEDNDEIVYLSFNGWVYHKGNVVTVTDNSQQWRRKMMDECDYRGVVINVK